MKRSTGRRAASAASAAAPPPPAAPSGKAPAAAVEAACPATMAASTADAKAAQDPSSVELCECCGETVVEGQWTVQVHDSLKRCHYDCWQDPVSKSMALRVFPKSSDVTATLPARDVLAMGSNLKDLRRELRDACQESDKVRGEARALKQDLAAAHDDSAESWLGRAKEIQGLCCQRDEARAAAEKQRQENMKLRQEVASTTEELERERGVAHAFNVALDRIRTERDAARMGSNAFLLERDALRVERDELVASGNEALGQRDAARMQLAQAKEHMDMVTAKNLDGLDDDQLEHRRTELAAALQRVENWKAARDLVAQECPAFCCSVNIGVLMSDPVVTADGRTFERRFIEEHFKYLVIRKEPMMTPQKQLLESTKLLPNHALKLSISAMVQKTAEELARRHGAAKRAAGGAAQPVAGGAAKRARG